jgi:hypothetical protein
LGQYQYQDEAVQGGEPGETGVAEGVAAEEEAGDLVPVQAVHILAHTALQHLPAHTVIYSPPRSKRGKK